MPTITEYIHTHVHTLFSLSLSCCVIPSSHPLLHTLCLLFKQQIRSLTQQIHSPEDNIHFVRPWNACTSELGVRVSKINCNFTPLSLVRTLTIHLDLFPPSRCTGWGRAAVQGQLSLSLLGLRQRWLCAYGTGAPGVHRAQEGRRRG